MKYIIGADEVGRGCVAGDAVVAAVMIPEDALRIDGVRDSKKLTPAKREALDAQLRADPNLHYAVVFRSAADVDKRGIDSVIRACFHDAVNDLVDRGLPVSEVRIDGRPFPFTVAGVSVRFIVKGDDSDYAIGAASIIAKVARDRYMVDQGERYPDYGLEKHAGYGTPEHIKAIKQHGLSPIHRATFCKAWVPPKPVEIVDDPNVMDIFG
jgi:ribonuclease HII